MNDALPLPSDLPKLAILDIDGTLTDTVVLHQAALEEAMRSFDLPTLNTDWGVHRHHTDSGIFAEAWARAGWGTPTEVDRIQLESRFERAFTDRVPFHPIQEIKGAAAFVDHLWDRGWSVAFATGGLRGASRIKLQAAGIPFTDDLLVAASEHLSREDIVSAAVKAATPDGIEGKLRTISLGDGLWDLLTAEALDLHFVGVGQGAKARLLADREATVLSDFSDVRRCFEVMSSVVTADW